VEVKCPLCGSSNAQLWTEAEDIEYRTTPDRFHFYHCDRCRVLFIHPVPVDQLQRIYPPNYYSYNYRSASWVFRIKEFLNRRFLRHWSRKVPGEALSALDVGGGAGWNLTQLRQGDRRFQYTQVVDLDEQAAEQAEANGHNFYLGRFEEFAEDRRFDLILMLNLVEHVENPSQILKKAHEMLNPGGLVLVQTPNFQCWDARFFRRRSWAGLHTPRHWVLFCPDSFMRLAEDSGFQVAHWQYLQGASFWASTLLGIAAKWGLVRIDQSRSSLEHPLFGALVAGCAALDLARRFFRIPTAQMLFALKK